MTKLVKFLTALAGVVALALLVLGGTSVLAPALADHARGHDEVARGRIGALEERVLYCENNVAPCVRTGAQGALGLQGQQGSRGSRGLQGDDGVDGAFADLVCADGSAIIADVTEGWVCSVPRADISTGG